MKLIFLTPRCEHVLRACGAYQQGISSLSNTSHRIIETMSQGFFLPPPPRTRYPKNSKFHPPTLDGSLLSPDIFDWHYEHSPNHPIFHYDDATVIKTIRWSDFIPAVHRAARFVLNTFNIPHARDASDRPVIGILTNSGKSF